MPDLQKAGGLGEGQRIANLANLYYVPFAPHMVASFLGAMASCHVCASVPNFMILEWQTYFDTNPMYKEMVTYDGPQVEKGHIRVSEKPGIGVEINEEGMRKYASRVSRSSRSAAIALCSIQFSYGSSGPSSGRARPRRRRVEEICPVAEEPSMPLNDLPCAALDSSSVENALSGMSLIWCSRSRLHCATSGRRALIRIWEQFGNNSAQTPGKTGEQGRPESRTNQQDRRPGPVCKTSIPGSNPGGASNPYSKHSAHLRATPFAARSPIWDHLGPIR